MADSNIQTPDTVKPITLDEYEERTAHLQENTTSLLSTIADRQVQAAGLATQAYSLASEVNAVAEQASLSFSKKTWEDNATSGTPITAAELNRLENAISNLTTAVNNLQDSVSRRQTRLGDRLMCYVEGGVCVIAADFLTVSQKNAIVRLGSLPDGLRPLGQTASDQTGSDDGAYIAPLRYRGDNSIYGQIVVLNSGEIAVYVNTIGAYYYGQLVFPVTRS